MKKTEIRTYKDLVVWQKSMDFVTKIYQITKMFPGIEMYGLCLQLRRAAVSIPSNIAEGYERHSKNDYKRFLQISIGSLFEVQTQLEIAKNLDYLKPESFNHILEQNREIERMLSSLIRKLNLEMI